MNAFLTNGYKPAGAYYSPINNEFSSNETKEPALQGRTVDIEEIIHATDPQASIDKHSDIVNMYRTDGKLNSAGALLSEKEFYDYLDYSKLIAVNAINEISQGFIQPTPYDDSCKYCKFNGMCDFCENEDGKIRKLDFVKKETIIGAVNNSNDIKNKKEQD